MDPLAALIAVLRPHAAVSKPITGRGDWGVRYAAYGMPGFALVLEGQCWLALDGAGPVPLARGDFVLLPETPGFALTSRPGAPCRAVAPSDQPVRHGDPAGAPDVALLGGSFQVERANAPLLLSLLPAMIHLRAAGSDAAGNGADKEDTAKEDTGRLTRILALIRDEGAAERPGRELVLARLLEVMLVEALRHQPVAGRDHAGLLAGLRDPAIARALSAIHGDVRAPWTVAALAGRARMSRSAFAARFTRLVGCGPIAYLAHWRMALAKDRLSRGGAPLDRIAAEIGYDSASAFSTAFRRHVGCAPGGFARACRPAAYDPGPVPA